MALAWKDVTENPDFISLSFDEQLEARNQYFREVVMPHVDPDERSIALNQFNEFADSIQPVVEPIKPEVKKDGLTISDFGNALQTGYGKAAQGVGWAAEKLGFDDAGSIREYWNEYTKEQEGQFSDRAKEARGKDMSFDDIGSALIKIGLGASESVPAMIMSSPIGGPVSSVLSKTASALFGSGVGGAGMAYAAGLASPLTMSGRIAASVPGVAGASIGEGVSAGLINSAEIKSAILGKPLSEVEKTPGFAAIYNNINDIADDGQRKKAAHMMLADAMANYTFAPTVAATAGLGAVAGGGVMGQMLTRNAARKAGTEIGQGFVKRAFTGGAEEARQEFAQSGSDKLIENLRTQEYINPNQSTWEGVPRAAIEGALTGAPMGAAFGAMDMSGSRQKVTTVDDILDQPSVDDAILTANEAINIPLPPTEILARDTAQGGFDATAIGIRNQETIFREELNQQNQSRQSDINELEALINDETADINLRRAALVSLQAQKRDALDNAFRSDNPIGLPSPNDPTGTLRVTPAGEAIPETRQQRIDAERARLMAGYNPRGNIDGRGINAQQPTEQVPVQQAQQPIKSQNSGLPVQAMQDGIPAGSTAIDQGSAEAQAYPVGDVPVTATTLEAPAGQQSANTRTATQAEKVISEKAQPVLDLSRQQTGWKRIEGRNNDSVTLVSFDGKHAVDFKSSDTKSGAASVRMNAEAHAFAIDNPYAGAPVPQGELISTPIYNQPAPLPQEPSAPTPVIEAPAAPDIIVKASGKPFTEAEAKLKLKTDKMTKTHKIVKVGNGFGIQGKPPRTEAQLKNDAKLAAKGKKKRVVDFSRHTLLQAIAIHGVDKNDSWANDLLTSIGENKNSNPVVYFDDGLSLNLFRKDGKALDTIAGELAQGNSKYFDGHDRKAMVDTLAEDSDKLTPEGRMKLAEQEYAERHAEEMATEQERQEAAIAARDPMDEAIEAELEWIVANNGDMMTEQEADEFGSAFSQYMEAENDRQRAAQEADEYDAGTAEAGGNPGAQGNQGEAQGRQPGENFALAGQTEAEIAAEAKAKSDAEAKAKAEEDRIEQKRKADAEVDSFELAGDGIDPNQPDMFGNSPVTPGQTESARKPESTVNTESTPDKKADIPAVIADDDIDSSIRQYEREMRTPLKIDKVVNGKKKTVTAHKALSAINAKIAQYKALVECLG